MLSLSAFVIISMHHLNIFKAITCYFIIKYFWNKERSGGIALNHLLNLVMAGSPA